MTIAIAKAKTTGKAIMNSDEPTIDPNKEHFSIKENLSSCAILMIFELEVVKPSVIKLRMLVQQRRFQSSDHVANIPINISFSIGTR